MFVSSLQGNPQYACFFSQNALKPFCHFTHYLNYSYENSYWESIPKMSQQFNFDLYWSVRLGYIRIDLFSVTLKQQKSCKMKISTTLKTQWSEQTVHLKVGLAVCIIVLGTAGRNSRDFIATLGTWFISYGTSNTCKLLLFVREQQMQSNARDFIVMSTVSVIHKCQTWIKTGGV
jgi:hypothetical protein